METSTTINKMIAGNKIFVPTYQRAYSWDTEQVNTFLTDLEEYNRSEAKTPYYFGHFLFEEKSVSNFGVIDGQQRLTTIVIFLSALFAKLKTIRKLTDDEEVSYENMVRRESSYAFSTVDYDDQLLKDYVINGVKRNRNGLETTSARRIVNAYDYFTEKFKDKDESCLVKMLETVSQATCTTHPVKNESEAIQMFIFQNDRGKRPSNLEIIKAQFMFNVHLYGGERKDGLINEIKERFEKIYKSISSIEYKINEDEVLIYTLRVHFNSLWETNAIDKIDKILSEPNPIPFIKDFTQDLATSFEHIRTFFGKDERENISIHSLIKLGRFAIAIPFVIKAYSYGLATEDIRKICSSLEVLVLRHRLIGTRASLTSRVNDVYQEFTSENPSIQPIIDRINWMKDIPNNSWWWAYWNKSSLEIAIQRGIRHPTAKLLLWKYENYLESQGKDGYSLTRFDKISNPELEHIAPQTPKDGQPIATGYCEYDEEFKNQYIDCLGNYLLLSQSHNCSIGNKPFKEKRETYNHLFQQREIQEMTKESEIWDKEKIETRKEKIIKFILDEL